MSLAERLKDPMNACLPPIGEVHVSLFEELRVGDLVRVGYENSGFFLILGINQAPDPRGIDWIILELLSVSTQHTRDLLVNKENPISGTWDVIRDGFLVRAKSYFP